MGISEQMEVRAHAKDRNHDLSQWQMVSLNGLLILVTSENTAHSEKVFK